MIATAEAEALRHKRRLAIDRAKLTWNRNQVLRVSSTGRLLLVLERCVGLVDEAGEMSSRRLSRLRDELSYACELADEAGIEHGWISRSQRTFSLAFALSSGDVLFTDLTESFGTDAFPREPIVANNPMIVARAIAVILSQQKNSALRRSTRISADVLVEVKGERFAYAGETVTINLHGALVRIAAPLKLGDQVNVYVHHTGKSAQGAIVFADYGASRFGVELENPENIWGVAAPPPDWNTVSSGTA